MFLFFPPYIAYCFILMFHAVKLLIFQFIFSCYIEPAFDF